MIETGALLAIPKVLTLVGYLSCDPQAAPAVKVHFQQHPAQVTNNLTHQQLGTFNVQTQFSHGHNEIFITGGITESNIKTDFGVNFQMLQMPFNGPACVWVKDIDVTITYAPVVHIASEYKQGTCRFESTWQHELKHVNTDIITLRDSAPMIEAATQNAAAALGVIGPIKAEEIKPAQDRIVQQVGQAVKAAFDRTEQTRLQRQQTIDTREEYMRLSKLCPGER
jgi:hypothetical protein